ncbi:hypothetical protein INT80_08485 [Gallibacterium anatis]|uniref:Uncharacterized protein n=1 Tax=Gallibacterium anatis TaxID=750 RepID=A0A930USX2_9PAST|nr:hypothetical protein [Gallibacterium anatis]
MGDDEPKLEILKQLIQFPEKDGNINAQELDGVVAKVILPGRSTSYDVIVIKNNGQELYTYTILKAQPQQKVV